MSTRGQVRPASSGDQKIRAYDLIPREKKHDHSLFPVSVLLESLRYYMQTPQLSSMCHICNATCILYMYYLPPPPPEKKKKTKQQFIHCIHLRDTSKTFSGCGKIISISQHQMISFAGSWAPQVFPAKPNTPHKSTRWAPTSFKWGSDPL